MIIRRTTILVALGILLSASFSHARRRKPYLVERLAIAKTIYVLPVDEHAYRAVLEIRKGSRRTGSETNRIEKTVADPAVFRKFNDDLLAKAQALFGEQRVQFAPDKFKRKAKRRQVEYTVFDTVAMDCDFYIEAKLGRSDKPREAVYLLTDFDMEEDYIWVDPFGPYVAVSLHEKEKPTRSGKKIFSATGTLVGVRDTKKVGERGLTRAVNGHVPGERFPRYEEVFRVLETDSLYWITSKNELDPLWFESEFENVIHKITPKIPDRLAATLAKFEVIAKKKMRPRRK